MPKSLSPSAQKVRDALENLGIPYELMELPHTTRSATEAAQAVGCRVEQIAKSLVFKGKGTHRAILVIACGSNRVNERLLGELVSEPVEKADADFVRQRTGFVIGGVPPVGHVEQMEVFIDENLLQHAELWAAAGNPNAVFRLTSADLVRMTGGRVVSIT